LWVWLWLAQVLIGHLVWVVLGATVLRQGVSPSRFFGRASQWMTTRWNTYWLWWAIGGEPGAPGMYVRTGEGG
jgi:hypothetical protein